MKQSFFEVVRDCPGRFPVQVVDRSGMPHPQLSVYASKAAETLSKKSVAGYLGEVLRVFAWSSTDKILIEEKQSLLGPAEQVRRIISEYLSADCRCALRYRQDSGNVSAIIVRKTNETRVNVKATLSAMKHFYAVLAASELYSKANPLVSAELTRALSERNEQIQRAFIAEHGRASPANSGGVDDNWRGQLRYSTNFFQLADGEWIPQVIHDDRLPALVYKAGESFGWELRDTVIAHLLFESAGRISDVTLRTLDDWLHHDCLNRLESDSKGSHGNRVKTLAFQTSTANLLRRYFNTERAACERGKCKTLGEMQKAIRKGLIDPKKIPLFLSRSGRPYSPNYFRDNCWRPAMRAAGIKCQPHQARHWYVTNALDFIDKASTSEADRVRRIGELVKYMRWNSGEQMLKAYNHTGVRAAANMKDLLAHMAAAEKVYAKQHLDDLKAQIDGIGNERAAAQNAELAAIFRLASKA